MRGRGEHPIDVTIDRLRAVAKKIHTAGLELTGVEEQRELARCRGRVMAVMAAAEKRKHSKPERMLLAEMAADTDNYTREHIAWLRKEMKELAAAAWTVRGVTMKGGK